MPQLVPGDKFPSITGIRDDGAPVTFPDDFDAKTIVALAYRGHW